MYMFWVMTVVTLSTYFNFTSLLEDSGNLSLLKRRSLNVQFYSPYVQRHYTTGVWIGTDHFLLCPIINKEKENKWKWIRRYTYCYGIYIKSYLFSVKEAVDQINWSELQCKIIRVRPFRVSWCRDRGKANTIIV